MVLSAQTITSSHFAESNQVNHVERGYVIGAITQVGLPIATLPETEAFHLLSRITKRCVAIGCTLQIEVHQFLQICTHDLVVQKINGKECE